MAALQAVCCDIVDDDGHDEFHALSGPGASAASDDANTDIETLPPVHPVCSLQGAFEESYYDSTRDSVQLGAAFEHDAEMRRRQLLEAESYEDKWVTRWRPRRGAKYHPYLKLIAQIVFGMHLLEKEQAKSNAEVVKILQHHVDDVDAFLERTWEDFDIANKDIEERIRFLRMPMNHTDVFEVMLDEKKFRTELLRGNEKLEKIVDRTTKAMNSALSDIQAGIKSTEELSVYLSGVKRRWPMHNVEIADVLAAMKDNEQGWMAYLQDLQRKGAALGKNLTVLNAIVVEIAKRAAAASRRNKPQRTISPTKASPGVRSKFVRDSPKKGAWTNKPLPQEPKPRLTISKPILPVSIVGESKRIKQDKGSPPRPNIAGHARGSNSVPRPTQTEDMRELAAFLRQSGPLRSHPPDPPSKAALPARIASMSKLRRETEAMVKRKPNRTQSHGGELLNFTPLMMANPQYRRSVSQGAIPAFASSPGKTISKSNITASPKECQAEAEPRTSIGSGFSQRVSKRLKSLPQPPIFSPKPDMSPRTIDSAFSHIVEKDFASDVVKPSLELEKPSSPVTPIEKPAGSRLALFPKNTGPMTPSQASSRSNAQSPSPVSNEAFTKGSGGTPQQPTHHASKSSVSMSLKNFFHRKMPSQSVF